ncbi:uncharacterized protein LOC118247855 [Cygnus atratus]|uniref:uncharacterized protein LOC118247855 n=1 Tax=Cygnus atratus TaxID=8868 RepID=UPI0015D5E894|nr:uncharacterized protein LOC118247855 [Cygnus atratus]
MLSNSCPCREAAREGWKSANRSLFSWKTFSAVVSLNDAAVFKAWEETFSCFVSSCISLASFNPAADAVQGVPDAVRRVPGNGTSVHLVGSSLLRSVSSLHVTLKYSISFCAVTFRTVMRSLDNSARATFEECPLSCFTLQGRNLLLTLQVHLAFQPSYSTAVTTNFLSDAVKCMRHRCAAFIWLLEVEFSAELTHRGDKLDAAETETTDELFSRRISSGEIPVLHVQESMTLPRFETRYVPHHRAVAGCLWKTKQHVTVKNLLLPPSQV